MFSSILNDLWWYAGKWDNLTHCIQKRLLLFSDDCVHYLSSFKEFYFRNSATNIKFALFMKKRNEEDRVQIVRTQFNYSLLQQALIH